jgi:hypothetical protein
MPTICSPCRKFGCVCRLMAAPVASCARALARRIRSSESVTAMVPISPMMPARKPESPIPSAISVIMTAASSSALNAVTEGGRAPSR